MGILIFKGHTARRLYKLFGVKGLKYQLTKPMEQSRPQYYTLCLKRSVNGTENKQNRRHKQINFFGHQNNHHPSQHTVGNVHKASGNCQQRPL
jgi:hypothetical protein